MVQFSKTFADSTRVLVMIDFRMAFNRIYPESIFWDANFLSRHTCRTLAYEQFTDNVWKKDIHYAEVWHGPSDYRPVDHSLHFN